MIKKKIKKNGNVLLENCERFNSPRQIYPSGVMVGSAACTEWCTHNMGYNREEGYIICKIYRRKILLEKMLNENKI